MALTDMTVHNAKCPADKKFIKIYDIDKLYLFVFKTVALSVPLRRKTTDVSYRPLP